MTWFQLLKVNTAESILNHLGYELSAEDEDKGSNYNVFGDTVYKKGEELMAVDELFGFPPSNVILHNNTIQTWAYGEENVVVAGDNNDDVKKIFDIITKGAESKKVHWFSRPNTLYIVDDFEWNTTQQEDNALGAKENYKFNQEDEDLL